MIEISKIREHMEVKCSDGKHLGTVLGTENGRVKIASGGTDHYLDLSMVDNIKDGAIRLSNAADELVRTWH